MDTTPEDLVEEFLVDAKRPKGGATCATCKLDPDHLAIIERACRRFIAARQSKETSVGWRVFTRDVLRAKLNYPYQWRAIKDHMSKCRGEDVDV